MSGLESGMRTKARACLALRIYDGFISSPKRPDRPFSVHHSATVGMQQRPLIWG
jgi:hypothetical protein